MEDNSTILYIYMEYLLLDTMALGLFKCVTFIVKGKLSQFHSFHVSVNERYKLKFNTKFSSFHAYKITTIHAVFIFSKGVYYLFRVVTRTLPVFPRRKLRRRFPRVSYSESSGSILSLYSPHSDSSSISSDSGLTITHSSSEDHIPPGVCVAMFFIVLFCGFQLVVILL